LLQRWRNQVEAFRIVLSSVAALLLAADLGGQSATSTWITGLLPPDAKVIETADVGAGRKTDRGLVLSSPEQDSS
jgi:hypothetical protein